MTRKLLCLLLALLTLSLAFLSCRATAPTVVDFTVDEEGNVLAVYSDGTKKTVGRTNADAPRDGVGIEDATVNAQGELIITYTDGKSVNLGVIAKNGKDGKDGKDGANGQDGKDGAAGQAGADGRGILSVELNDDGELIITYTDRTQKNLGVISAPKAEETTQAPETVTDGNGTLWHLAPATVYVLEPSNLSLTPDGDAVLQASHAAALQRLRYSDTWTVVAHEGIEYYLPTKHVTTDAGHVTFTPAVQHTVYCTAPAGMNLRSSPYIIDGIDNIATGIGYGGQMTLIAINNSEESPWACVQYNGELYYCRPRYLSDTPPSAA